MYDRKVGKQTLTLTVSGMLWNRSLVMRDQETGSLWSHLLGRAMRGSLQGKSLDRLPGLMTDWKTWRTLHPHTTVLNMKRTAQKFRRQIYKDPQRFVVGYVDGDDARAWAFDQLHKFPVINDQLGTRKLLIAFDVNSGTTFLYQRSVDGQMLTMRKVADQLHDQETGSVWNIQTGRAISGPLQGRRLKTLAAIVSFRKAWTVFHPQTSFWTPSTTSPVPSP